MIAREKREKLKKQIVKNMTTSVMNKLEEENLSKMLKRARLIHPDCGKIALKLRVLCQAEDERTPPEYAGREHDWEGRSPFLLEDGSPKPEVVEWANHLYSLNPEIGMFSVVECIPFADRRELDVAFNGIGGWKA